MFGFLRPPPGLPRYRQVYARLCQFHRAYYGMLALPFLSYEAALLYAYAVDSGWFPAPEATAPGCCRLRRDPDLLTRAEAPLGEFCASLGLLLGAIKLDDDVRDGYGIVARLGRWTLRRPIDATREYFRRLDPAFEEHVEQFLVKHVKQERPGNRPPMVRYAEPTGEAFAYVFGLLARIAPQPISTEALCTVGRYVGEAIIAFDCAVDWPRDQRTGNYNPLANDEDRRAAFAYCNRRLMLAAALCRRDHASDSLAAYVLEAAAHRVQRRLDGPVCSCGDTATRRWRRSGYVFSDLGLLAFLDCACEGCNACVGCSACCEAGGGAAEGASACGQSCGSADTGSCCCDFCCAGCTESCTHRKTNERKQGNPMSNDEPPPELVPAGAELPPHDDPHHEKPLDVGAGVTVNG